MKGEVHPTEDRLWGEEGKGANVVLSAMTAVSVACEAVLGDIDR